MDTIEYEKPIPGTADLSAAAKHEKYFAMADWRKRHVFLFKTIALALICAFVMYDITWAQGGIPVWQHAKVTPSINRTDNKSKSLPIPDGKAEIEDTYQNGSKNLIINIQDAHASLSAQYSIVDILNSLVTDYDLNLIAVEGSEGYIDTSILRTFPDKKIKKETAEYLMEEGRMSAGEFFTIVSDTPLALYGIENNELYKKNVTAFRNITEDRVIYNKNLRGVEATLRKLESKIYKKDLRDLNQKSFLYDDGELKFSEYWRFLSLLAQDNNIILSQYKNIIKFSQASDLEKTIDFEKATDERKHLIDELSDKISKEELEELVLESISFKKEEISKTEYHKYLIKLAERKAIPLSPYKNLIEFTRYISIYESIDLMMLCSETKSVEELIREKLFTTKHERKLYELQKKVKIMKRLFNITLTNN
ncbi:MAG: hypothetical protein ABIH42_02985, partial [Planctomycetota bacterium]